MIYDDRIAPQRRTEVHIWSIGCNPGRHVPIPACPLEAVLDQQRSMRQLSETARGAAGALEE